MSEEKEYKWTNASTPSPFQDGLNQEFRMTYDWDHILKMAPQEALEKEVRRRKLEQLLKK